MTTSSSSAPKLTPTQRLTEALQQVADAKVDGAQTGVHLKYARWGGAGAAAILVVFLLIVYLKPATVVRDDISEARVEAIANKLLAKLPTPQPGLTQEQVKNLLTDAFKGFTVEAISTETARQVVATQAKTLSGIDEKLKGLADVPATQATMLDSQDIIKTMLTELPAKIAPQKGSEQKQEEPPVADKRPLAPADASGNPVQNSAAPQQPAAERKEFSAKDVAKACTDLNVKFQKPFEQMSQADLKAAFEQCEAAEKTATSKRWRRASKEDCPDRFDESAGACRKKMN
jgi:hypothetical protein